MNPALEAPLSLLVRDFRRLRVLGLPLVLATIVDTAGSTYRKAGTRMLIAADRLRDVPVLALRLGTAYGLGMRPNSVFEIFIAKALKGEPITIHGGRTLTVVGVAESTASRNYPRILGLPGALGLEPEGVHQWLIGGGAVSWAEVRAINGIGALVLSRSAVENPPPDSERPAEIREWSSGVDEAVIAVVVLIFQLITGRRVV